MSLITFHFSEEEMRCRCGCGLLLYDTKTMAGAEAMRARFLRAGNVLSGARCPKHNADVGGVGDSQHLFGKAIDLYFDDIPVASMAQAARQAGFIRIGSYYSSNPPFVHVDSANADEAPQGEWNDK